MNFNLNYAKMLPLLTGREEKNRFTVVYHIYSIKNGFRLALKADVDESDCSIDSVASVWKTADWEERETYDMYGIIFNNHPDLKKNVYAGGI